METPVEMLHAIYNALHKHGIVIETWGRDDKGQYLYRWRIDCVNLVLNDVTPYATQAEAVDACMAYLFEYYIFAPNY